MIEISTDKHKINIAFVHEYLSTKSYWAKDVPLSVVQKSIENSLCFVMLKNEKQIGFARMITDYATFSYLCDVFIAPTEQGNGYGIALMKFIDAYPDLQNLRRIMLATADAHSLYEKFGYKPLSMPERIMEIKDAAVYQRMKNL